MLNDPRTGRTLYSAPSHTPIETGSLARLCASARWKQRVEFMLLASTILALLWSNSPWHQTHEQFFETHVSVGFGKIVLTENRHEWINDGLMSLFFSLVGLEIKREILVGELSSVPGAAFPFMAAVGGRVVSAAIYVAIAHNPSYRSGWAIPQSTDIAFTLGLLTFFGSLSRALHLMMANCSAFPRLQSWPDRWFHVSADA